MVVAYKFSHVSRLCFYNFNESTVGDKDEINGNENTRCRPEYSIFMFMRQTQNDRTPYRYNNTIHALVTIAREEGYRGFYKGLGPSLIGVSHVAVQFPLYERLKVVFRKS